MREIDFNTADVLTGLDTKKAEEYIGMEGYFSNYLEYLVEWQKGTLTTCRNVTLKGHTKQDYYTAVYKEYPFMDENNKWFNYFIPATKVKTPEKPIGSLRPFKNFSEFRKITGKNLGDVITVQKINTPIKSTYLITGISVEDEHTRLTIGDLELDFGTLFSNYLWIDDSDDTNTPKPFGLIGNLC